MGCVASDCIIKRGTFVTNNDVVTCNKKLWATNLDELNDQLFFAYVKVSMLNE